MIRLAVPDLEDYLDRGQIEFLDYQQWYIQQGRFDANLVLQGWNEKLASARKAGFEGLRLTVGDLKGTRICHLTVEPAGSTDDEGEADA